MKNYVARERFIEAKKKVYTLGKRYFEAATFEGFTVVSFHME